MIFIKCLNDVNTFFLFPHCMNRDQWNGETIKRLMAFTSGGERETDCVIQIKNRNHPCCVSVKYEILLKGCQRVRVWMSKAVCFQPSLSVCWINQSSQCSEQPEAE